MLYLKWKGKTLNLRTPAGYLRKLATLKLEPFPSYEERKRMIEAARLRYEKMVSDAVKKYEELMRQEMARLRGPRFC